MSLERDPIFQDAVTAKKKGSAYEECLGFVQSTFFPLLDSPGGYDSVDERWWWGR